MGGPGGDHGQDGHRGPDEAGGVAEQVVAPEAQGPGDGEQGVGAGDGRGEAGRRAGLKSWSYDEPDGADRSPPLTVISQENEAASDIGSVLSAGSAPGTAAAASAAPGSDRVGIVEDRVVAVERMRSLRGRAGRSRSATSRRPGAPPASRRRAGDLNLDLRAARLSVPAAACSWSGPRTSAGTAGVLEMAAGRTTGTA